MLFFVVEEQGEDSKPIEQKPNIIQPCHFKVKNELLEASKSEPNLNVKTPTRVLNPFAIKAPSTPQNQFRGRVIRCQQTLERILQEGSNHNTIYLDNCRKLLKRISDPHLVVQLRTLESIEEVLASNKSAEDNSLNVKTKSKLTYKVLHNKVKCFQSIKCLISFASFI